MRANLFNEIDVKVAVIKCFIIIDHMTACTVCASDDATENHRQMHSLSSSQLSTLQENENQSGS